ncbi:iron ABC transporter permease [Asticcacaulis sp. EMRT-3]|uniref:FecCD family ABC transporter permease n=1 Tax=Asticcacaulis sp. EMRT-3 TaxID=3040349 RepID=UPI0024AE9981|nr:iron ABC transporter permease [Asticcacaulis sp. EMRT-3]MDI7774355.1 iron ABC transporter permease [Asticcacaulis sp. EMRT-3]
MHVSTTLLNLSLAVAIVVLLIVMMLFGDVPLSAAAWLDAFIHWQSIGAEIVWGIRLPRNLTAIGVGAMLGMSGALMQGLLRNPLAEPGLLGVSAGAGLGAAIAIVLGLALIPFTVAGFALIGATGVAFLLLVFVQKFPQRQSLILLGVGLSALCGATMALVFNLSPSPVTTSEMLGWMMGSVENRDWFDVMLCVVGLAAAGALSYRVGKGLRFLTLGEETARSMGIDMTRLTQLIVISSSLLAGLSVAVAGVIGFVGLAAPHFVRAMGIRDPYRLIVPSALTGALIVQLADGLVRIIPTTGELHLGVVTSLIGAPLFAVLAYRSARSWMQD